MGDKPEELARDIGYRVKKLRGRASRSEFVQELHSKGVALSESQLALLEMNAPSVVKAGEWIVGIARALGVTVTALLGLTSDPTKWEPDLPFFTDSENFAWSSHMADDLLERALEDAAKLGKTA